LLNKKITMLMMLLSFTSFSFAGDSNKDSIYNEYEHFIGEEISNPKVKNDIYSEYEDFIGEEISGTEIENYIYGEHNNSVQQNARGLTGIEYEHNRWQSPQAPNQELLSYILYDGAIKLNENWKVLTVVKKIMEYDDGEAKDEGTNSIEVRPRYEKQINQIMNFGMEFGYEAAAKFNKHDILELRPDISINTQDHFLNLNVIHGSDLGNGKNYIETEPFYVYKINKNFNMGFKLFYKNDKNTWKYEEASFRPLIQFMFDDSSFLELRYEVGYVNSGPDKADKQVYAMYSEFPVYKSLRALLEVKIQRFQGGGWGDQDNVFVKTGIIWTL